MSIGKESGASRASKAKIRDNRKTGEFKKMLRPGLDSNRVEVKKGGKMNAGLKAFLDKKKKMKKGKK